MRTKQDQDEIDLNIHTVIQNGNYYYEVGDKQFISKRDAEGYVYKQIAAKYRKQDPEKEE
jgi:hypothetical protein